MAFFENMKQSANSLAAAASVAAQKAVQQGKTAAAIGRIKLAIATEEDKMKKAYTELGKLFYKDFKAEAEAEMAEYLPWCDKVTDAQEQIERLNAEIAAIKASGEVPAEEDLVEVADEPEAEAEVTVDETADFADVVVVDAPVEENPVEEAPVEEAPVVGTLYVDETPVEE